MRLRGVEQTVAETAPDRALLNRGRTERVAAVKRLLDTSAVVAASPLLLMVATPVALTVRLSLGKPVIYKQTRIGRYGKPFTLYKFRSMRDEKGSDGEYRTREERHTKIGDLLRKSSLDELPQLVNVLVGDMALVGPRPLLPEYLPFYSSKERLRHAVRPGVTGASQVTGRNDLGWDSRLATDVEYVERVSILRDVAILWDTAKRVLVRSGVESDPSRVGERLDSFRSYPRDDHYSLRRLLHSDLPVLNMALGEGPTRSEASLPFDEGTDLSAWLTDARSNRGQAHLVMYELQTGEPVAVLGGALGLDTDASHWYIVRTPSSCEAIERQARELVARYIKTGGISFI